MTKAVILSNKGKGLYSARIEYDTDRLDDRIAFIQAAINATDDLIAELEEALTQVESDRDEAGQALRDAIAAYEQAKIDMELEKDQARLDAAAVRDQAIAAANGSHDSTVGRVNDDIQEASLERQAAIAAANDQYAIAEAEHRQGLDDADHDFAVCVDSGTEYATCRDTRDEEYERLDAALQDAADRRDEAIASADDTYDSAYERGQKTIEASEATRDAAIDKAESAYVQTLANIDGDFKALEAPMQAVTEANLEYIKTLQPVQNAESQIGMQEINRLSAEQQLAVLQAAREERVEDVWCADYTLNLQPDDEAGLIWPDIDANKLPIVMPGGRPAEYQARAASEQVMGPASSFFNRAIMPILQRIKPRHKIGKVTAVNEDGTLNVELRADLSRFGRVNTVIASGLSSVPVEYMNYGALPFEVGDDVVVRFDGIDQTEPVVIGFEHDPKIAAGFVFRLKNGDSWALWSDGIKPLEFKKFSGSSIGTHNLDSWSADGILIQWYRNKHADIKEFSFPYDKFDEVYSNDLSSGITVNGSISIPTPDRVACAAAKKLGDSIEIHIITMSIYGYEAKAYRCILNSDFSGEVNWSLESRIQFSTYSTMSNIWAVPSFNKNADVAFFPGNTLGAYYVYSVGSGFSGEERLYDPSSPVRPRGAAYDAKGRLIKAGTYHSTFEDHPDPGVELNGVRIISGEWSRGFFGPGWYVDRFNITGDPSDGIFLIIKDRDSYGGVDNWSEVYVYDSGDIESIKKIDRRFEGSDFNGGGSTRYIGGDRYSVLAGGFDGSGFFVTSPNINSSPPFDPADIETISIL